MTRIGRINAILRGRSMASLRSTNRRSTSSAQREAHVRAHPTRLLAATGAAALRQPARPASARGVRVLNGPIRPAPRTRQPHPEGPSGGFRMGRC